MTPVRTRSTARSHRTRSLAAAAACLSALAVLAACGDAGGDAAAAGDDGSCSSPGVTDDEITVAAISPLTGGAASSFTGFQDGVEARFAQQNDDGGVAGRQLTMASGDDAGDGAVQVVAARNAVQSQEAFGVISASRIDTMYDYLKKEGVPVTGYMGQPAYMEDENVFGFAGGGTIGWSSTVVPERMKAAGAHVVANLAHNSPASINGLSGFSQAAQRVGLKIGTQVSDVPLGAFDATSLAVQMKEGSVDALYSPLLTDSSVSVLRAAQAQQLDLAATYAAVIYEPAVADQISQYIQGAMTAPVYTVPNQLTDNPDVQAYLDAMDQYAPAVDPSAGFTEAGYISADLFVRGLEEAGDCLSRASFIENLRGVTDYDGAGLLLEPAAFSGGDAPNGGSIVGRCSWFVTREGDEWVPDADMTCGELFQQTK